MYFRVGVTLLILVWGLASAKAQMCVDDTIRVEEVTVYSTYRQLHTIGTSLIKIDTLKLKNFEGYSLTELLQSSGVNVRSYGVSGLGTVALRGGSSSHTAVVWNGINLQSPMNGGVNLSQLPVTLFNSISIQHGGSGTAYGSGAVSGIVVLENGGLLNQPNGFSTSFLYGEGNTKGVTLTGKMGNAKNAITLKYSGTLADNDFEFINTFKYGNPRERISNAQASLHGLLADFSSHLRDNILWNLSGWFTYNDKNIQTLMSSSIPSSANQVDNNFALSSNFNTKFRSLSFKLRNAIIAGDNRFNDPGAGINSLNAYKQIVNEFEIKYPLYKNHELVAGFGYNADMASSQSYTQTAVRQRLLSNISIVNRFIKNKLIIVLAFRDELVDGSFIPMVFSSGLEYKVTNGFNVKASAASSYRLPTLNDLYWASTAYAVGNPNLKPERGWNADWGFELKTNANNLNINLSSAYFISELNDWIVWLPDAYDNNRWKPNNLNRGKSQGIESFLNLNMLFLPLTIKTGINYTYTKSKVYDNGNYAGKPMIYIPLHRVGATLSILNRHFSVIYNHSFASKRYTDELNKLPYYNVGDIIASYSFTAISSRIILSIGVNNIWNEQYQLVRNFAMPLRNSFVRLKIEFHAKSTK